MNKAVAMPSQGTARLWGFAGTALVLGPAFSYCFGLFAKQPIVFGFPIVALALLALSIAFGLWGRAYSAFAKVGVVLWTILIAWASPIVVIIVLNFECAILNGRAGHYVCGL